MNIPRPRYFHVIITYSNGSGSVHEYPSYLAARDFCRDGISYSGGRVKRVTIREPFGTGEGRAIWDKDWDDLSKQEGLRG